MSHHLLIVGYSYNSRVDFIAILLLIHHFLNYIMIKYTQISKTANTTLVSVAMTFSIFSIRSSPCQMNFLFIIFIPPSVRTPRFSFLPNSLFD